MTDDKTGGQAFPSEGEGHGEPKYHSPGMTLRDWFAGQALIAVVGNNTMLNQIDKAAPTVAMTANVARMAYALADAMLGERSK